MSSQTDQDVVTMLLDQHARIRALLQSISASPDDSSFQELVRLLAVHETAEEEVVYPSLRRSDPDLADSIEQRKEEENAAKSELAELEKLERSSPQFAAAFPLFRRAVEDHAAAEERTLFPALGARDEPELRRMGTALRIAEAIAPTHPHPNAPQSAAGNLIVGPFVAIADRVRDALRARSA